MPVAAVADPFDRAVRPPSVFAQAVLDGVPGKRHSGRFLGGRMDLADPKRPIRGCELPDHGLPNSAGWARNSALHPGLRPWPGSEGAAQQVCAGDVVAVHTCPVFFHLRDPLDQAGPAASGVARRIRRTSPVALSTPSFRASLRRRSAPGHRPGVALVAARHGQRLMGLHRPRHSTGAGKGAPSVNVYVPTMPAPLTEPEAEKVKPPSQPMLIGADVNCESTVTVAEHV